MAASSTESRVSAVESSGSLNQPSVEKPPRRAEVDVVSARREPVWPRAGGLEVEEALVGDAPDDRILPGVGADAVARRRLQDEKQRVAADVGVGGVGLLGLEPELGGVVAARQDQPERVRAPRARSRVGDELGDRLAGLEDPRLLDAGTGHVADVVAGQIGGAVAGEERGDDDEEDHALHRRRSRAVRGAASVEIGIVPPASVRCRSDPVDPAGWIDAHVAPRAGAQRAGPDIDRRHGAVGLSGYARAKAGRTLSLNAAKIAGRSQLVYSKRVPEARSEILGREVVRELPFAISAVERHAGHVGDVRGAGQGGLRPAPV